MRLFRVSVLVYAVVLLAGLYYAVAGLSPDADPLRLAGFVAGIGVLVAVESLGGRHVVALLALRLALYVAVAALDESGLSRVLFVLVPFTAYLQLGRRVGLALGGVSLVLLLGGYLLWMPGWYTDATSVSDVLMFCVGLVLALSMAAIATREREARARATELSAAVERTRLARDIHDGLGHHLTAIAVQLEKAEAFRDLDPAAADRAVVYKRQSWRCATCARRCARCGRTPTRSTCPRRWRTWCATPGSASRSSASTPPPTARRWPRCTAPRRSR